MAQNNEELASKLDKIFSGEITFVFGSSKPGTLLRSDLKEVAFIGKSNVGKSSLINALTSRKALARVSNTPGRTQQINFFKVRDIFHIVDLPGYGYAKVSKSLHKDWEKMILKYLEKRENLAHIFLLIDSRHGIKENDEDVMALLNSLDISYSAVFTKADKMIKKHAEELAKVAIQKSGNNSLNVFFTSSKDKTLLADVKAMIYNIAQVF